MRVCPGRVVPNSACRGVCVEAEEVVETCWVASCSVSIRRVGGVPLAFVEEHVSSMPERLDSRHGPHVHACSVGFANHELGDHESEHTVEDVERIFCSVSGTSARTRRRSGPSSGGSRLPPLLGNGTRDDGCQAGLLGCLVGEQDPLAEQLVFEHRSGLASVWNSSEARPACLRSAWPRPPGTPSEAPIYGSYLGWTCSLDLRVWPGERDWISVSWRPPWRGSGRSLATACRAVHRSDSRQDGAVCRRRPWSSRRP